MPIRITPLTELRHGASPPRLVWLASHSDGYPVGSAYLRLTSRAGQTHLAEADLHVHPDERRHGIGSQLMAAAVAAARQDGRRSLISQAEAGSPGDLFLAAQGFRKVLTLMFTRLALETADLAALTRIAAQPHPGYRLTSWDGVVPDELAETFAASRRAMDDMPMDDTDFGTVAWDVEAVRAAAAAVAERGELLHTVAVIDESDGSVAGFTELVVPGDGEGDGQHYGTGVLPEHRGHGLGRWMKAEAIRRARQRHPGLGGLLADTAEGNLPMRRINDALGYQPTHRTLLRQLDL
ncbi:N-acetyltransferase family protein [Microbispora sp. NPDC049125]|uniref:GNAT family N-acetyltransferase n=1 Tax=Microbispora sp. NPDC049125 TaxID=3154929 RepID=UPI00346673F3